MRWYQQFHSNLSENWKNCEIKFGILKNKIKITQGELLFDLG